jgi:hypothetical protein
MMIPTLLLLALLTLTPRPDLWEGILPARWDWPGARRSASHRHRRSTLPTHVSTLALDMEKLAAAAGRYSSIDRVRVRVRLGGLWEDAGN